MGAEAGQRPTVSDEIAAHDEALFATNQPACCLEQGAPDVPTPTQLEQLNSVFRAACDDLAVDTEVHVVAVRWITGDRVVRIHLV